MRLSPKLEILKEELELSNVPTKSSTKKRGRPKRRVTRLNKKAKPSKSCDEFGIPKEYTKYTFSSIDQLYSCQSCNFSCGLLPEMQTHVGSHAYFFTCEICGETFDHPYYYSLHVYRHTKTKFECPLCTYKTSGMGSMRNHILIIHLKKFPYYCAHCNKGFNNSLHLLEHEKLHTGETQQHECVVCKKVFSYSYYLQYHQVRAHRANIQGVISSNQCPICLKLFAKMNNLKTHMVKHEKGMGKRGFKQICDLCGKEFSCNYKLKLHYRIHTGHKPFKCNSCGKTFSKKDYLVVHERVHSGEKPFECEFCGKCFNQRASKRTHTRIHTGERPYVCSVCTKGFISKTALNAHRNQCPGYSGSGDD